MIRATNTGMTAAIDPNGVVRAALEPMSKGVLDVEIQGMQGLTPYVRWGNAPVLVWSALLLLLALALGRRRRLTH
jgi:apolipoprotein N-acyltransferase